MLEFFSIVFDLVSFAIGFPGIAKFDKTVKAIKAMLKYYTLLRSMSKSVPDEDFGGFISAVANGMAEEDELYKDLVTPKKYKTQNYTLSWAFALLSFSSDLETLAETFASGPHFYKELFTYYDQDLNYNIMIRTTDNKLISLSDINSVIE